MKVTVHRTAGAEELGAEYDTDIASLMKKEPVVPLTDYNLSGWLGYIIQIEGPDGEDGVLVYIPNVNLEDLK